MYEIAAIVGYVGVESFRCFGKLTMTPAVEVCRIQGYTIRVQLGKPILEKGKREQRRDTRLLYA